jgi:hypothetical protein
MPKKTKVAVLHNRFYVFSIISSILLLSLSLFGLNESFINEEQTILGVRTEVNAANNTLEQKELFWQNLVEIYPQYQQGWIEIAKISMVTNNADQLKMAIIKLREINPNLNEIAKYEKVLEE